MSPSTERVWTYLCDNELRLCSEKNSVIHVAGGVLEPSDGTIRRVVTVVDQSIHRGRNLFSNRFHCSYYTDDEQTPGLIPWPVHTDILTRLTAKASQHSGIPIAHRRNHDPQANQNTTAGIAVYHAYLGRPRPRRWPQSRPRARRHADRARVSTDYVLRTMQHQTLLLCQ